MMEFVVGTISLSCDMCSLSKAAFVHVRPAQLCTENGISIYMCSAVDVAWLAHSSDSRMKKVGEPLRGQGKSRGET